MNSTQILRDITAYLDSVAPLYPGGIPKAKLSNCSQRAATGKVLLVTKAEEAALTQGEISGAFSELLMAVANKGLRLNQAEYAICAVTGDEVSERELGLQAANAPRAIVSFGVLPQASLVQGELLAHGRLLRINGISFLLTIPLAHAVSPEGKKLLWNELKLVLSEIGAGSLSK